MGRTHDCGFGKLFLDLCNFVKTFRTFFLLLLISRTGETFNILTGERNFIRNPHDLTNVDGNNETHFFGYDFSWKLIEEGDSKNTSFLIGSPKGGTEVESWISPVIDDISEGEDDPSKPGDLFSCGFSFDGVDHTCQSISPSAEYPDDPALIVDGDSMGLSLMKPRPYSTTDAITACAPLRARNCTSEFLSQGACFSSKDHGKTWLTESKQATTQCPVQLIDLIFVLDGSGSVTASDPKNFDMVKTWVKRVAGKFDIREFAHVAVIQYSHWYKGRSEQPYLKTEIRLGQFQDQSDFEEEVDKIAIQGYTTYTAHAISKTVEDFMQSERFNDTATQKVMILLTDGRSNDADDLPASAAYARSLGITIFAVGVAGFSEKELQIIATGEIGNHLRVYGLQKFSDLQQIVWSLQKSITGILEGGVSGNKTNDLQNAETGIGGAVSQTRYNPTTPKDEHFACRWSEIMNCRCRNKIEPVEDERLKWLEENFLKYLLDGKPSVFVHQIRDSMITGRELEFTEKLQHTERTDIGSENSNADVHQVGYGVKAISQREVKRRKTVLTLPLQEHTLGKYCVRIPCRVVQATTR